MLKKIFSKTFSIMSRYIKSFFVHLQTLIYDIDKLG